MEKTTKTKNRFLRLSDVIDSTGLSKSTIYSQIQKGTFPASIKLTERSVAWLESDIDEWMHDKLVKNMEKHHV